ncbi:MAG: hypothetical protein JNM61_09500 [Zoogloeaceae bacterium]|nr:hypothetical protein [Zoogloeaceae bacterium]
MSTAAASSLPATAALLWRASPRWRWTVVAAMVLTVLALMGRMGGGSGSGSPSPAPLPMPGPGATPGGGTLNTVPPVNQMASVRLADFHTASTQADAIKGEVERCEARAAAFAKLQPGDAAQAQMAQKDDIQKAQACAPLLAASDKRWTEIAQAFAAVEAAPARGAVQELQAGLGKLDPFDLSRSAAVRQNLGERINTLAQGLDAYDEAVKALARQVALYTASNGTSLDAAKQIQEQSAKLRTLAIRPRPDAITPAQAETLAEADRIGAEVDAAEQRLQTLAQAWQRRDADPQTVANLIAQLSDVDRVRWDNGANRPAKLAAMEVAVAAQLPGVLQNLLSGYERERTRVAGDRILGVQALAGRLRAPVPGDLRGRLDKVVAEVEASKMRLARLLTVEQAWNAKTAGTRNAALEQDVIASVRAVRDANSAEVNRYDAGAFGEHERRAWTTLHSALAEITGGGPGAMLSVAVDATGIADRFLKDLPAHLASALKGGGFIPASNAETASIRLVLTDPRVKQQANAEDGMKVFEVAVQARAHWVYRGSETDLGTISGTGKGDDANAAIGAAQADAAKRVAEEIGNRLKRGS